MPTGSATPVDARPPAPPVRADAPHPTSSAYQALTGAFNRGRCRAISSGQACVPHRIAFASNDGDWLLREDQEALSQASPCAAAEGMLPQHVTGP